MTDPLLYRDDSRVRHMLDAMERIVEMCRDLNRAQLRMHEDKTEIILFNLMVLGEAANNISREFAEKNPDVDCLTQDHQVKENDLRLVLVHPQLRTV